MNNKEKYIAEVDSLRAGDELKNAILEKAQMKPGKSVYKKIIPLAACLVIALLIALPGFVFRAGRAKSAADEIAYDNAAVAEQAVAEEYAEEEIADYDNTADRKSYGAVANSHSKSESGTWYVDVLNRGLSDMEQKAVLGYSYNSKGDYFYIDDKSCWQQGSSYNDVYDNQTGFSTMFIDKIRIRFDYEDTAYMIQLWKGQYGWVFVGGEISVYTSNDFKTTDINRTDINHYYCADKSDWINMSMNLYWDKDKSGNYEKLLSRPYAEYWWCNGFRYGNLNNFSSPITELIMKARITFKSATQASLFTNGMKRMGFKASSASGDLSNDSVFQNDSDVYFKWCSVCMNSPAPKLATKTENSDSSGKTEHKTGDSIWDIFTAQSTVSSGNSKPSE